MNALAVVVVVVDLMASEHEAVKTLLVNKHLFQFDALLSHVLIVHDLVRCFRITASIKFCFNQKVASLSVDPQLTVLHYNLLEHRLRELFFKPDWLQHEGVS